MAGETGPESTGPWWPKLFDADESERRAAYLARPLPRSLSAAAIREANDPYDYWDPRGDIVNTNGMGCMPSPGMNARAEAAELIEGLGQPPAAAA